MVSHKKSIRGKTRCPNGAAALRINALSVRSRVPSPFFIPAALPPPAKRKYEFRGGTNDNFIARLGFSNSLLQLRLPVYEDQVSRVTFLAARHRLVETYTHKLRKIERLGQQEYRLIRAFASTDRLLNLRILINRWIYMSLETSLIRSSIFFLFNLLIRSL